MNRTNEQNKRFYLLLSQTHFDKNEIVRLFTNNRTEHSSEMNEQEMDACLEYLQKQAGAMNESRRRIFSRVRQIKLLHQDDKLSEAEVLRYIYNIVGLNLPKKTRLNDYTKEELWQINKKLDAIKPKQAVKYRKHLKSYSNG